MIRSILIEIDLHSAIILKTIKILPYDIIREMNSKFYFNKKLNYVNLLKDYCAYEYETKNFEQKNIYKKEKKPYIYICMNREMMFFQNDN